MKYSMCVWCAVALWSATADAQSLRCSGDLASIGDSKASVLQKCGAPFFQESFCKPMEEFVLPPTPRGAPPAYLPCVLVDEWSYNPGPGQFITIMRFEAGVMTSLRYGERVR